MNSRMVFIYFMCKLWGKICKNSADFIRLYLENVLSVNINSWFSGVLKNDAGLMKGGNVNYLPV